MFVDDDAVKASVAAALHKAVADLPTLWTQVIGDANEAAYRQIIAHFVVLGYTQAQIDTWDSGPTYQKFIARYQALIDGAGDKNEVGEWRTELDYWRGLLETIQTLEVAAEVVDPHTGGSTVGRGDMSNSSDIFSLDTEW